MLLRPDDPAFSSPVLSCVHLTLAVYLLPRTVPHLTGKEWISSFSAEALPSLFSGYIHLSDTPSIHREKGFLGTFVRRAPKKDPEKNF